MAAFDRETGMWSHMLEAEVLESSGLLPLGKYLEKRQIRVVHCIPTYPILGLCLEAVRPEGMRESRRW